MTPTQLKKAREKLGVTQSELAEIVGLKWGRTVRKWEGGESSIPGTVHMLLHMFLADRSLIESSVMHRPK